MNQSDLGGMGLDSLDYNSLDYNPTPGEAAAVKSKHGGQQKWSQIGKLLNRFRYELGSCFP